MRSVTDTGERLRRRVYEATGLQEVFNDSNISVVLKSSPDKTVAALSPLAEKEGQVVKLNDSNSWKRRHALLVPHTFLYYFGSDGATELRPHGVIDLEHYTDVKVVDDHVVRLAPGDDTLPIRTFYFRLSDKEEAEDWADVIRETRLSHVKDERDAFLAAKDVLTEQVVTLAEQLKESRASVEVTRRREAAALSELAQYDASNERRVEHVQALLAAAASSSVNGTEAYRENGARGGAGPGSIVGAATTTRGAEIGPERSARVGGTALSELAALGEAIADRGREVADLKAANALLREEAAAAAELRRQDAAVALDLLEQERQRTAAAVAASRRLEEALHSVRRELELDRATKEEARANLGIVAAACREAEAKTRQLQEHRRVLAREVKASRVEKRRLSDALACATTAAAAAAATVAATAGGAGGGDGVGGVDNQPPRLANCCTAPTEMTTTTTVANDESGHDLGSEEGKVVGGDVWGHEKGEDACETDGERRGSESERAVEEGRAGSDEKTADVVDGRNGSAKIDDPVSGSLSGESDDNDAPSTTYTCFETEGGAEESLGHTFSQWRQTLSLDSNAASSEGDNTRPRADTEVTSPEAYSPSICDLTCADEGCQPIRRWEDLVSVAGGRSTGLELMETRAQEDVICDEEQHSCDETGTETVAFVVRCHNEGEGDTAHCSHDSDPGQGRRTGGEGVSVALATQAYSPGSAVGGTGAESRLNAIVQSFSVGVRENRRARRTPLLGSSIDDCSCNGDGQLQDDDGDVTDGTDGDSLHHTGSGRFSGGAQEEQCSESAATASSWADGAGGLYASGFKLVSDEERQRAEGEQGDREEKNEEEEGDKRFAELVKALRNNSNTGVDDGDGTDSTNATLVARGQVGDNGVDIGSQRPLSPPCSLSFSASSCGHGENTSDRHTPVGAENDGGLSTTPASTLGLSDCNAPAPAPGGWKVVPVAYTITTTLATAANFHVAEQALQRSDRSADWISKVARPDESETTGHNSTQSTSPSSLSSSPGSDVDHSGDSRAATATAVGGDSGDLGGANTMGMMGEAAAAAAVAAAERGSRASLEAAAAARRWEAKLKGSFMSMTGGGVRWGMGPQRLNGVPKGQEWG